MEESEETKKNPIKTERASFSILSILIGFFAPFTSGGSEQKVYVPLILLISSGFPSETTSIKPKKSPNSASEMCHLLIEESQKAAESTSRRIPGNVNQICNRYPLHSDTYVHK